MPSDTRKRLERISYHRCIAMFVLYQIHRWRYSQAIQGFEEPYAFIDDPGPCILFGDAFGGNRVEGAFLSGISAANHLISFMDSHN